jgi:hypothetical protein
MKIKQVLIDNAKKINDLKFDFNPDLIISFGKRELLETTQVFNELKAKYPNCIFNGCSTAGEIHSRNVFDDTISITAVKMENATLKSCTKNIDESANSFESGINIGKSFDQKGLKHVVVFSDGLNVNGSELVKGLNLALGDKISVTGGLAGDGPNFKNTVVLSTEGKIESKIITATAFYGDKLKVSYGSVGGWDSFGIERLVTNSKANVLYELDNKPALDLYKTYLGEQASGLPATGLKFPLSMRISEVDDPVVRTILAINEKEKSLTFAGDIIEGSFVRLMKANVNRLIDGAEKAAEITLNSMSGSKENILALLISCVGRKLVLKQLVEEEIEVVGDTLGENATLAGFYSYGEIAPFSEFQKGELHNQTMTITAISE